MKEKKNRITPLKLSGDIRSELEKRKSERGISFVQSVEDAISGKDRFNVKIESEIASYQSRVGCSRPAAIEAMLIEAIAAMRAHNANSPQKPVERDFSRFGKVKPIDDGVSASADDSAHVSPPSKPDPKAASVCSRKPRKRVVAKI